MKRLGMLFGLIPVFLSLAPQTAPAQGGGITEAAYRRLHWRYIGPANMGGRIDDIAVVENDSRIIYIGAASGGVWKSSDNGITWNPVFDDQAASSIGDVTVAPSDPNIVWVGTGEPNNRQSSSWGNGVYKSLDGGVTWEHMGLGDSHHIGRIVIDRSDPDTVYVAAVGRLWGPNRERGLFKTVDGGRTWVNVLFVNEDTGVIDVAMDPNSRHTLYAAAYQRRRTPWGFNGGGPHSGLYRSIDGGNTWKKLTRGLPAGDIGRIGIDIYRRNPDIVYAIIENRNGGVFRSEDRGETWTRMSGTNPRPMYYSNIRVDPNNDQRIWVLGASMAYSEDGGKSFRTDLINIVTGHPPNGIHGDFHALWIDPADSNHMLLGSDGGINVSYSRGRTWSFWDTIPLGQFYEIGADLEKPYRIYGGLQDNGNWMGPSRTVFTAGISNEDWMRIGGGDGFYTIPDPKDPNTVYVESQNGNMARMDLRTLEKRPIRPEAPPGEPQYRFDWNSPLLVSPHDHRVLYFGGNRLFRSTDQGDSWTASEDLTTRTDRDKIPIMGMLPGREMLSRHDGTSSYGQIITLAESPLKEGVIWVGTDDGNVQVSSDRGKTFRNVTERIPGVPPKTYVSRVVASSFASGRAYVTFDGHRGNDFTPYIFVTEDQGDTWRAITGGIAMGHTVNVVREHPRRESLLFAGTEFGAYVSFDRGLRWLPLKSNLATVPVDDIFIHARENDLIFGTHGRSVAVMDDITPLEQLTEQVVAADLTLFDMRPAVAYRLHYHKARPGNAFFIAPNPDYGAYVSYYLREETKDGVAVAILDSAGKTVRELKGTGQSGINRISWDLRWTPPVAAQGEGGEAEEGPGGSRPNGPLALPGEYTVRVRAGGSETTRKLRVEEDPRIRIPESDRRAQFDAIVTLNSLYASADGSLRMLDDLRRQLDHLAQAAGKQADFPSGLMTAVTEAVRRLGDLRNQLAGRGGFGGEGRQSLRNRIAGLATALDGYTARPSPVQEDRVRTLSGELKELQAKIDRFLRADVAAINREMLERRIAPIRIPEQFR